MIKGAIFDLDGTIIDSMDMWMNEGISLLHKYGVEDAEEICRIWVPKSMAHTCEYVSSNYNIGISRQQLVKEWEDRMEYHYLNTVRLKANIMSALDYFKKSNIRMIIATATIKGLTSKVLERLQIKHYFEDIITTHMVNRSKDFPDVYLEAARTLNLKPIECVVFEDAYHAIKTAKDAGFNVVAIREDTMGPYVKIIEENADYIIDDYSEVKQLPYFEKI